MADGVLISSVSFIVKVGMFDVVYFELAKSGAMYGLSFVLFVWYELRLKLEVMHVPLV